MVSREVRGALDQLVQGGGNGLIAVGHHMLIAAPVGREHTIASYLESLCQAETFLADR